MLIDEVAAARAGSGRRRSAPRPPRSPCARLDGEPGRRRACAAVPPVASSAKPSPASAWATGTDARLVAVAHREERRAASRAAAGRRRARPWRRRSGSRRRSPSPRRSSASPGRAPGRRRGSGANGNTAALTETWSAARAPGSSSSASGAPAASRQAASTRLTPVALLANGTVREARGFASSTKSSPSASASWTLSSPTTPSAGREPAHGVLDRAALRRVSDGGGQHAGGVARVDARLLDVLHHRGDAGLVPVAERVDVDLDRVLEEAVDEQRPRTPARLAHVLGGRSRPASRGRRARRTGARAPGSRPARRRRPPRPRSSAIPQAGTRDPEPVAERGEALAVLGEVDRLVRRARGCGSPRPRAHARA